jgi:hypothetical protein
MATNELIQTRFLPSNLQRQGSRRSAQKTRSVCQRIFIEEYISTAPQDPDKNQPDPTSRSKTKTQPPTNTGEAIPRSRAGQGAANVSLPSIMLLSMNIPFRGPARPPT